MADKAGGGTGQAAKLHVAYGNALMRRAAMAQPRRRGLRERGDFAVGDKDASERLAADYGLWAGGYARGELSAMRSARRRLPRRRRGEPRFARGRSRSPRSRSHALVCRRVSRSARTSGTRARPIPTRPRRRSGVSLRTGRGRCGDAFPRAHVVATGRDRARRFSRSATLRRGSRASPISARAHSGERALPCSR